MVYDGLIQIEQLTKAVISYAEEHNYTETLKAYEMMKKYHDGQERNGPKGQMVPYIIHPLAIAYHVIALGIDQDYLVAAALLHDVVEDCGVSLEELDLCDKTKDVIDRMTFRVLPGHDKAESKYLYFKRIEESSSAMVIKILDRCNNISNMSTGFTKQRMDKYIKETNDYIYPMLDILEEQYPEYAHTVFLVKYHLNSVISALEE